MNFYIHQIKLWFKNHPESQTYDFEPDAVNVITGDSSTGKSSILRIIDYCLLSKEASIVEEVINANVSWYGLRFHLNGKNYAIIRKAPQGSDDHHIYWGETDVFPEKPNELKRKERHVLIQEMNDLIGIPDVSFETLKGKHVPLDFRYFLVFNYLTEDVIATSNTYFDTKFFEDINYDLMLGDLFKYAIGVDKSAEKELKDKLEKVSAKVRQEEKNKANDMKNKESYQKAIEKVRSRALALGMIADSLFPEQEELLQMVNHNLQLFNDYIRRKREQNKVSLLEEKERNIKKQLDSFNATRKEYKRAIKYIEECKDSLAPVEYLKKHFDSVAVTGDLALLMDSLEIAYNSAGQQQIPENYLPTDFQSRYLKLEEEYRQVQEELAPYRDLVNRLYNQTWLHDVLRLEDELKKAVLKPSTYCGDRELIALKEQCEILRSHLQSIEWQNKNCISSLMDNVKTYFDMQRGMDSSYNGCDITYDEENHTLRLMKDDDNVYKLVRKMGSKSNFMFMHLCFYLGLHQYIQIKKSPFVGNFLFIDQPSIPYYGNVGRSANPVETPGDLRLRLKTDEEKLTDAFGLIDFFMRQNVNPSMNESFQIIMVEHASPEYWKNLSHFKTKYIFTEDRDYGLIPKHVTGE